ncbi:hypothetical protein HGA91_00605 [candidate division WWE3 bacterium]|nr:hypothetical protein [candidate division WWE3 bacterium]
MPRTKRELSGRYFSIIRDAGGLAGRIFECPFDISSQAGCNRYGEPQESGDYEYCDYRPGSSTTFEHIIAGIRVDRQISAIEPYGLIIAASVIAQAIVSRQLDPDDFAAAAECHDFILLWHWFGQIRMPIRIYSDHHHAIVRGGLFAHRTTWATVNSQWQRIPPPDEERMIVCGKAARVPQ